MRGAKSVSGLVERVLDERIGLFSPVEIGIGKHNAT